LITEIYPFAGKILTEMETPLLIAAILATILLGVGWSKAVVKAGVEGPEPNVKGAIPSAVLCGLFLVVGFFTLQLLARFLAVWTGYSPKVFPGH
jgi:hypothetical protein